MPSRYVLGTIAVLALLACSKQSTAVKEDSPPKPGQAAAESAREPESAPAAPAGLSVVVEPEGAGTLRLRIQNRGQEVLALRPQLGISKQGATADLSGQSLSIRPTCDDAPADCVALAPGAELMPVALHLRQGDMQCGEGGPALAEGPYEVVVHGCQDRPYRAVTAALSGMP